MAQSNITFQHLNTGNGLSYTGVNDMCTDKNGNLWIATGNGLNMFNGKTTEKYLSSDYPQLQSSNIIHVTCDGYNRIWVLTANGYVVMLDEKRQLHKVSISKANQLIKIRWILNAGEGEIILFSSEGHYQFNKTSKVAATDSISNKHFTFLPLQGFEKLSKTLFRQVFYYDAQSYLFVKDDVYYKVNYQLKTIEKALAVSNFTALVKWNQHELLGFDRGDGKLKLLNLNEATISEPFKNIRDQSGNMIHGHFLYAEKINDHTLLLTTADAGIYIFDIKGNRIFNYTHEFANPYSLAGNTASTITVAKNGWVFITCNPQGISYFNSNDVIGNQHVFIDEKGNGYDGYILGIASQDNNTFYIGTSEGLLEWNRRLNKTVFINLPASNQGALNRKEEVHSIVIDRAGNKWIATQSEGVIVLDKDLKTIKRFKNTEQDKRFKLKQVVFLSLAPDGNIWATGEGGICKIDPNTYSIENFRGTPLAMFDSVCCPTFIFTSRDDAWLATTNAGVFHYNFRRSQMKSYTTSNGLADNGIFCLNADSAKNIYVGTRQGLNILFTNGSIKTITQKDGLLIDRAEGLLLDKQNRVWIGNDIGLACYNPKDSSLKIFDERYGLSVFGFRVGSYFQMPGGEFIFGTPRGLQYFFPDALHNKKVSLTVLINKIETKQIASGVSGNDSFNLSAADNQVSFYFNTVDFSQHVRTFYQYQLEGVDKTWKNSSSQTTVRYTGLPAGNFVFRVRASNNNINWFDAKNKITIYIATAFYNTLWFKLFGLCLMLGLIIMVINFYRKKQLQTRYELETELVITWFASQINRHQNIEKLVWDIAKNCISKLHFDDCVIYLLDEKNNVLVQKAAYGPKNPVDFTIHQPLDIPVGTGIVGKVAETGKAALINNTTNDPDYIVDDKRRMAEIAVPIIINNKVVGVIDSESNHKNFFTAWHMQVLSTVAVLCANQIQTSIAEEANQAATIELLENKQKATESRLQSLRLQMNPHFLFNALNSIQQMILANEDVIATRYLSKFSKLLRTILVQSDKETISLKEEIDMLKLYIELESIRFKESFQYSITCDENIDLDEIKIPVLLIQPFVENAIWHGLMHKEGKRLLTLEFKENDDDILCVIQDNGIGRESAARMKMHTDKDHSSRGISVSRERLNTLGYSDASIKIIDLSTGDTASGTRIEINFPMQNSLYA